MEANSGARRRRPSQPCFRGRSHADAARIAGIDPSTLKRWLRLPEFQAEYLQVRREAVSQTNARIQHHSGAVFSVALRLVAETTTPASVRANLCLGLLDRANKSLENDDILVRIAALERGQEEAKKAK